MTDKRSVKDSSANICRLARLIADYEEIRFAKDRVPLTPLDMLEHMMEEHNHTAKDLWEVIGDKGTVSKILKGDRSISKSQAKRLGVFITFHRLFLYKIRRRIFSCAIASTQILHI